MGGNSQPQQAAPAAPSVSETSAQAIQSQIDALPKILAAQQQFGPQFSQLEIDQLKQFGPQYAQAALDLEQQFGTQLAYQTRAEQAILAPERIAGSEYLSAYISGAEDLTPQEEMQAKQQIRAGQAERGMAFAGQSSADELKALTEMRQALKTRKIQTALSVAGQQPATGAGTVNSPTSFGSQLVQNVTPAQTFGLATSNYATGANMYNASQLNATQRQGQWLNLTGSLFGGAGTKFLFGG